MQEYHLLKELQRRFLKILEERSVKSLLQVGNLYQPFTTLGQEPVSMVHYTRPGTCINHPLHQAWIQYQVVHPKLISSTMPCKLACCLPRKYLQNHGSSISGPSPKIFEESSLQLCSKPFIRSSNIWLRMVLSFWGPKVVLFNEIIVNAPPPASQRIFSTPPVLGLNRYCLQ